MFNFDISDVLGWREHIKRRANTDTMVNNK